MIDAEVLNLFIKLIITIISVAITTFIIPWIKSNIESTKYNDFLELVHKCVEAANQLYTPDEWEKKKLYVLEIVHNYCLEHGVNITTQEMDAIIEGFVKAVKGE